MTSFLDYNGQTTEYTYDECNRLLEEKNADGRVRYSYKGNLVETVEDENGLTAYQYDKHDRVTEKTMPNGAVLSYTYDAFNRLSGKSLTVNDREENRTGYEYDILNRITRVIDRNGKATVYEYDEAGNRSAVKYANGITLTFTYDACSRLTEQHVTGKWRRTLQRYHYTYGKNGEKLTAEESASDGVIETEYAYDAINRLTKEIISDGNGSITNVFTYDAVSNRLAKKTTVTGNIENLVDEEAEETAITRGLTDYTYNSFNQLLREKSEKNKVIYYYDNNGNLTGQQAGSAVRNYKYDAKNRLVKAEVSGSGRKDATETYRYDFEGNRISKQTAGEEVQYIVDSTHSLAQAEAELDGEGNVQAVYHRGTELISMERNSVEGDNETSYYIYDGHGDVRALADGKGNITDTYRYEAYGNLLKKEGNTENAYLYTGEYQDEGTGLYYLRARYMNPDTGNFLTMDTYEGTLEEPASQHKYGYVHANPVAYNDPTGHMAGIIMGTMSYAKVKSNHDALALGAGMLLLFQLRNIVAQMNAVTNIHQMMFATVIEGIDWMTIAVTQTVDELRAKVEAKVEAGTLVRKKDKPIYTVYTLEDMNYIIRYVGRTKDYDERMKQHRKAPNGKIYKHNLRAKDRYDNLTYEVCRGLEQTLMVYYHTRNWLDEGGFNFVNGVAQSNKKGDLYYADTITYFENQRDNEFLSLLEEGSGGLH